jgi:hypothetical protein
MKTQVCGTWFTFIPPTGKVPSALRAGWSALLRRGSGNGALCFLSGEGVSFQAPGHPVVRKASQCTTRQVERLAPPGKARVANSPVHPGQRCVGSTRERHVFRRGYAKPANGLGGTGRFASSTLALEKITHTKQ